MDPITCVVSRAVLPHSLATLTSCIHSLHRAFFFLFTCLGNFLRNGVSLLLFLDRFSLGPGDLSSWRPPGGRLERQRGEEERETVARSLHLAFFSCSAAWQISSSSSSYPGSGSQGCANVGEEHARLFPFSLFSLPHLVSKLLSCCSRFSSSSFLLNSLLVFLFFFFLREKKAFCKLTIESSPSFFSLSSTQGVSSFLLLLLPPFISVSKRERERESF